jgi:uncharacterized repeat protein (TIGR02543 family)
MAALEAALITGAAGGISGCNNGIDDDDDSLADTADPGCTSGTDPSEITPGGPACDNGLDDDGDGRIDSGFSDTNEDPGCSGPADTGEHGPSLVCDDGLDNDGNGAADYPADLACTGSNDGSEGNFVVLSILKDGSGNGTIGVDPPPSCAPPCYRSLPLNTPVSLTAQPAPGSAFTGWAGACQHTNLVCAFNATASKTATATFSVSAGPYTLTVTKAAGVGTVTSGGNEINCAPECTSDSEPFPGGSVVTLTAAPAAGYRFAGWSGACTNASGPCVVTMTGDMTAAANFVPAHVLTLTKDAASTGTGSVTSSPSGIECDAACTSDTGEFAEGTSVVLTAQESADSVFVAWGGECAGTAGPQCSVSMTAAKAVSVRFDQQSYTLDVTVSGDGDGSVSSAPAGIDGCRKGPAGTCSASFLKGTQITLTAAADPSSFPGGFVGPCQSGTDTCTFTIQANASVTATFNDAPANTTLVVDVNGPGSVSSSPAGIDGCREASGTCSADFPSGTPVTLTATADTDATFSGFTGDCESPTSPCTVTMTGSKTVVATFASGAPPLEVKVNDSGFTPKTTSPIAVGTSVRWTAKGTRPHSAVEHLHLGPGGTPWFDSGSLDPNETYTFRFSAAGSFPYVSTSPGDSGFTGTVRVALGASPLTGSTSTLFSLAWASEAMSGYGFDVQYRYRPPGGSFGSWTKLGGSLRTDPGTMFDPDLAGSYQFRTRLKNTATSNLSSWSPNTMITVN